MIEAVAPSGKRYRLHSLQHASSFAKQLQDANELKDAKNFSRAVDPSDLRFHFCENWQGIYNVRFVEKVDTQSGELLESALIWGQPRHSMREFYDCLCVRWPELRAVSFESTFCRFLKDGQRKITGFRVRLARDIPIDEMERRLPLTAQDIPIAELERRLPLTALPALAAAVVHGISPAAANSAVTSACSAAPGRAPVSVPIHQGHLVQCRLPPPSSVHLSSVPVSPSNPSATVCAIAVAVTPVRYAASVRPTTISASPATGHRGGSYMQGVDLAESSHALNTAFAAQLATSVASPTAQAVYPQFANGTPSPP